MKTSFKVGDYVKVNWVGGRVVYAVIREEFRDSFRIEALNSETFETFGKSHKRWVKKSQVLSVC